MLADFTHGSMAQGPVSTNQVQEIAMNLIKKAEKETSVVSFDPSLARIENELVREKNKMRLEGGSCSAIALKIAKKALKLFELKGGRAKFQK